MRIYSYCSVKRLLTIFKTLKIKTAALIQIFALEDGPKLFWGTSPQRYIFLLIIFTSACGRLLEYIRLV